MSSYCYPVIFAVVFFTQHKFIPYLIILWLFLDNYFLNSILRHLYYPIVYIRFYINFNFEEILALILKKLELRLLLKVRGYIIKI